MVYSDTTTNQGLLQECESILFASEYGKITGSTSLLQTFTRYMNQALGTVSNKVMQSDRRWRINENSHTQNLVADQKNYTLPTTTLKVIGVSILESSGDWKKLRPIDVEDFRAIDREEIFKNSSIPTYYDLSDSTVYLYPAPASGQVTTTNGLKVYYQGDPSYFATTDTTKEPGLPETYHRLVVLWTCYYYALANTMSSKMDMLVSEIKREEDMLQDFISSRNPDDRPVFTTAYVSSK